MSSGAPLSLVAVGVLIFDRWTKFFHASVKCQDLSNWPKTNSGVECVRNVVKSCEKYYPLVSKKNCQLKMAKSSEREGEMWNEPGNVE